MEPEAIHDLTSAYALDALDADEAAEFEQHLRHCERCQAELAELQGTTALLAYAAPSEPAPAALRGRILEQARAERSNVIPFPRSRRRTTWAFGAAAAVGCSGRDRPRDLGGGPAQRPRRGALGPQPRGGRARDRGRAGNGARRPGRSERNPCRRAVGTGGARHLRSEESTGREDLRGVGDPWLEAVAGRTVRWWRQHRRPALALGAAGVGRGGDGRAKRRCGHADADAVHLGYRVAIPRAATTLFSRAAVETQGEGRQAPAQDPQASPLHSDARARDPGSRGVRLRGRDGDRGGDPEARSLVPAADLQERVHLRG